MMNGYRDITDEYANQIRIDFARVKYGSTFSIDKLFKDPDGRIFEPAGAKGPNLFAVLASTAEADTFMVVAEFSTYQDAEELLKNAEDMGHKVVTEADLNREFYEWLDRNQGSEFITKEYVAFSRTDLSALDKRDSTLLMVELIKVFGGILIPEMHQHSANLFPVFAATDKLELVAEFWDRSEAEKFLANAQAEGWRVMQGHHIFAGLKWLASFEPATARVAFPWIEREFPHWSSTKLQAAA